MKITKILFFATTLFVLLFSCEKAEVYETQDITTRVMEEEIGVGYASVYFEDPTSIVTKAAAYEIQTLSFFVFDGDGVRDAEYGFQTFKYTGNQYTFAVTPGKNKTIVAVANLQPIEEMEDANLETVQRAVQRVMYQRPADNPETGTVMTAQVSGIYIQQAVQVIKMTLSF